MMMMTTTPLTMTQENVGDGVGGADDENDTRGRGSSDGEEYQEDLFWNHCLM